MEKQNRTSWVALIAATGLVSNVIGIGIGSRMISPPNVVPSAQAASASAADSLPLPLPQAEALQKSAENFRAVAKRVAPSVVTIRVSAEPRPLKRASPGRRFSDDSMERMLERFGFQFDMPQMGAQPKQGSGSGFVIDRQGHILTNNHVVSGASEITVLLPDDESEPVKAKVVGLDPRSDLAVLKIDTSRALIPVEWADFENVEVGDHAIAIGSPFNLTHSVTAGIVSAKGRNSAAVMGAEFGTDMLQTDAAINPGNSGGPLCTADGRVMGVNTAIFSQTGGYMGIGFAIPSSTAKEVAANLIATGHVVRGWLGVQIQLADNEMKKDLGVDSAVVVHAVQPNSPAEAAGFRAGDAIVQIDGKKVAKVEQVQSLVSKLKPGAKISVQVVNYSDRKTRSLDVKIGQLPEPEAEQRS